MKKAKKLKQDNKALETKVEDDIEKGLYENENAFSEEEENNSFEEKSNKEEEEEEEEEEILYDSEEEEDDEVEDEELEKEAEKLEKELALKELMGLTDGPDSDEEWDNPERNTVGNIPMEYYNDYDHIGYNIRGEKIMKPKEKDEVDKILQQEDNWRVVKNTLTGEDITISKEDYELIKSIIKNKFPEGYDPYEEFLDTPYKDGIHPLVNYPPKKSAFVPSRFEKEKIKKILISIRKGYIKLGEKKKKSSKNFYMIWDDESVSQDKRSLLHRTLAHAPKMKLPSHIESYNPPEEYLPEKRQSEDNSREYFGFVPTKYNALRNVPYYKNFLRERFERCLDLYQAPRVLKKPKLSLDLKTYLPELPSPEDLKPFPTKESLVYTGHTDKVRSISPSPDGHYLVSGSDDGTIRIWEVETTRCVKMWNIGGIIGMVAWNPVKDLIAASSNEDLYFLNPNLGTEEQNHEVDDLFSDLNSEGKSVVNWEKPPENLQNEGVLAKINQERIIKHLSWHFKGDYLSSVATDASSKTALFIHQISSKRTQNPFRKQKNKIQAVMFHPSKPFLFIATQLHIKVYNLSKKQLEKTLMPGVKWVSSFDVHPGGDNIVMGSYDKRVCWFDLDLSAKPYKLLRYHKLAVRNVVYHKKYPLFASCSDDCSIHIFHGMVYNDFLKDPLIVPVKILKGYHQKTNDLGILHCIFHPSQPWLFSCGADGTIRLYT